MHALLRAIGVIALIAGLGFLGHGSRFFSYPGEGFMIRWVYYGAGMAVVGLLLIIFSRPSDERAVEVEPICFDLLRPLAAVHPPIAVSSGIDLLTGLIRPRVFNLRA